jgi:hypothetical protein
MKADNEGGPLSAGFPRDTRRCSLNIRGTWETGQVWMDERELSPERSQAVVNHSPTGFSWGYGGSGPAQLALALLLEITTKDMALLWYQDVKWQMIAKLPQADFTLDSQEIVDFITNTVQAELVQGGRETPEGRSRPPGVVSRSNVREVDLRYSRDQLQAMFQRAYAQDVEKGGRYDGRSGAINVYTHPWNTETMRTESTLMGSIYVFWGHQNRIWQIEIEEGFSFEDLLVELGTLEEKALGMKVHGR